MIVGTEKNCNGKIENKPKPKVKFVQVQGLPESLKKFKRWVVWSYEFERGNWQKIPYRPHTNVDGFQSGRQRAASDDPDTWASYQDAVASLNVYDGLGFMLGQDDDICFSGVDLDDVVVDGKIRPSAMDIIAEINSYTEISPSGTGVKILALGAKPTGRCRVGNFEMYSVGRFFTLTGAWLGSTPRTVEDRGVELTALHTRMFSSLPKQEEKTPIEREEELAPELPEVEADEKEEDPKKLPEIDPAILDSLEDPDAHLGQQTIKLDSDIELQIMAVCLHDAEFIGFAATRLKPTDFDHPILQTAFSIAVEFNKNYNAAPTLPIILNELKKRNPTSTVEDCKQKLGMLEAAVFGYRTSVTPYLKDQVELKAQETFVRKHLLNIGQNLKKGDLAGALGIMYNPPERQQKTNSGIRVIPRSQLDTLPEPTFLIKQHIAENSFGSIFGPYETYKSFLALEAALSIANGLDYLDQYATKPGKVVYLAAEGYSGIIKRIRAWEYDRLGGKMTPDSSFALIPDAVNLLDPLVPANVVAAIKAVCGDKISFIVLDTLARCFGSSDENSTKDMNVFVLGAAEVQRQLSATVCIVHHSGKDAAKYSRGSVSFAGACDWMIQLEKTAEASVTVINHKQKDFAKFETYTVTGEKVVLGENQDSLVMKFSHNGSAKTNEKNMDWIEEEMQCKAALRDKGKVTTAKLVEATGFPKKKLLEIIKRMEAKKQAGVDRNDNPKPWEIWLIETV